MNLKQSTAALCLVLAHAVSAFAVNTYPVALQQPPVTSHVTQTYDAATGIYNIHVDENPFGDDSSRPTISFAEITEILPEYAKTLAFEYKSTHSSGPMKFVCYKLVTANGLTKTYSLDAPLVATDTWETYRIPVGSYRGKPNNYGERLNGQYQDLIFTQLITGANLQIRNIRYEDEEVPYTDVTVTPDRPAVIEAENFNLSGKAALTHASRQKPRSQGKYISPTPGQFPIYAFTSVDYIQQNVSNDFMTNMKATADLMNKKYRDMEACGINITEGGTYPAIDRCFLFDGLSEFNGYQANLHEGITNLNFMIRGGVHEEDVIRRAMQSPRCVGYHIIDEPHVTGFNGCNIPAAASKANFVRNIDDSRLLYGNLLHINTIPSDIGATSYDDYVTQYAEKTGMGVLSYDYYAVRIYGPDAETDKPASPDNCILMPNFFMNMEVISKLSKYYNIPWWGFSMAQGSGLHTNPSSVYMPGNYRYPSPFEDGMRVQIFSLLCYGAQGIQYWPYAAHGEQPDGPCNPDGSLNPSYYYAKAINTEIKALTWVFLGAEMLRVGHTNDVTPVGCLRLTKAIMPDGVADVTTSGSGMPVSTLQNGSNLFMMAVNPDLWNEQDITVTLEKDAKQVLPDGSTVAVSAGKHTVTLKPGRYLIYLLDENAPELDNYTSPNPVYDNYRGDISDVAITADTSASNGFYLPDMGTTRWGNYSLPTPLDETRTITREQAVENWGAWYAYTFEVAEDMTADISIGHSVPWNEYGRVAATGAAPGVSYTIQGEPALNWPKQYAASLTLSIDGETLIPAQQSRPVAPDTFDEDGSEYNAILADKSRWTSTAGDENLYLYPYAGGDNDITPRYNETPDYRGVRLKAGTHRIVIKSNCYPWNFDNILISPTDMSGIAGISGDNGTHLKATAVKGGILIETEGDFTIYNLAGVAVASGNGSEVVNLNAGFYIVAADKTSIKVIVK